MSSNSRFRIGTAAALMALGLAAGGCASINPGSGFPWAGGDPLSKAGDNPTLRPDLNRGVRIEPVSARREVVIDGNVRARPTVASPAIGSLPRGETVDVIGKVEGYTWMLVVLPDGQPGYMHGSLFGGVTSSGGRPAMAESDGVTGSTAVRTSGSTFGGYTAGGRGGRTSWWRESGDGGGSGGSSGGGSSGGGGGGGPGGAGSAGNAGSAGGGGESAGNAGSAL